MIDHLLSKLSDIGKGCPGLWKKIDETRRTRSWPLSCFLPFEKLCAILRQLRCDEQFVPRQLSTIASFAAWRVTQGVYQFDPSLSESVQKTPLFTLPCEAFLHMPEWCVYIATPTNKFENLNLRGFFASIDTDAPGLNYQLRILLDDGSGDFFSILPVDLGQTDLVKGFQASRARILSFVSQHADAAEFGRYAQVDLAEYAKLLSPLLNLLLYLCSTNAEIYDCNGRRPQLPRPTPTSKGPRLFGPPSPTRWEVGYRLGSALRLARQSASEHPLHGISSGRVSPVPHIRRAHWHSYWLGALHEPALRTLQTRWLPPVAVNVVEVKDLIPTVRTLRA